jgi:hypothetical protein
VTDRRKLIGLLRTFAAALEADAESQAHLAFGLDQGGCLAILADGEEVSVEIFGGPGDASQTWRVL